MGSVRLLLGGLSLTLLLCGCVATVTPPTPGLTEAEIDVLTARTADQTWEVSGLPNDLRPPDPTAELVSGSEEWVAKYVECMNDAGYADYEVLRSGSYGEFLDGQTQEEQVAIYLCSSRYVLDPGVYGLLNHAELDVWYDYFEQILIPCLELHQVEVTDAPSRAQFHESLGGWNPYWAISANDQDLASTDWALHQDCPAAPPGYSDSGFW